MSVAEPEFEIIAVIVQSNSALASLCDMGVWHALPVLVPSSANARPKTHPKVPLGHLGEDVAQGAMVRAELHLARAVEEEVMAAEGVKLGTQPVQIGLQVLHAVQQAAVGPQPQRVHHVAQTHQLAHVHGALVRQTLVGRVQVHYRHAPAHRAQELAHAQAVCGLPRTRRADHSLSKGRGPSGPRHGWHSAPRTARGGNQAGDRARDKRRG